MSRLTDAEFIYAPAQIALASLYLASSELAEQWARAKGLNQTGLDVIKEAAEMIGKESKGGGIDVELVREVDRRLRLCKNPEKIPGTKASVLLFTCPHRADTLNCRYMKRQAAAEAAAAEKRARKAAAERESQVMEVDVFGEKIANEPEMHPPSSPDD
jgi:cyclin H